MQSINTTVVCTHTYGYIHACVHTYIQLEDVKRQMIAAEDEILHTYIHIYIHTCMHTYS